MRAAAAYTLACSVLAMVEAGGIALLHGWWRPVAALLAVVFTACACGGMAVMGTATEPERRP